MAVAAGLAVHVALEPLDDEALAALLASLDLGHDRRLAPSLQRLTGGNPQFLIETLKSAHDGRIEELLSGAATTPAAVTEIIERRLDHLDPLALRVARTIAVLDQPADADALAAITGRSAFDVTEALAGLEAAQVLRDGDFVHDLLRETVARLTPAATRAWLHGRVADRLEGTAADPRRVAHHRYQAETIESARSN
jgi:predicted ATPase